MKILITGGLGFIGLHLTRALIPHCAQIDLVDVLNQDQLDQEAKEVLQSANVCYLQQDLLNLSQGFDQDYDYLFHFAALLGVQNVSAHPYRVLQQNSLSTMSVIEQAMRQKQLKKIFFTSTSEVYAGTLEAYGLEFPTREDVPLTISPMVFSRTSYMLSKIYGEGLLNASGLPFVILRPHNIYGPRMGLRHVIPQLLEKAFYEKNFLEIFSPSHTRTFCYVSDAVNYLIKLIESDAVNVTLNLGVESPEIAIKDLANMVLAVTEKSLEIKEMPDTKGSPLRRVPSTAVLKKLTGYHPQISLLEGIRKTYEWYKKHQFEK